MNTTNERVKVEIKVPANKTIEYNGATIEINPYIDFAEQVLLINEYIKDLFDESNEILIPKTKNHIFEAECRLKNYIVQINTNIDMSDVDNNIYIDDLLWNVLIREIHNYSEFRKRLEYVVFEVREQIKLENSLGKVLSGILEKVEDFIDQMESGLKKAGAKGKEEPRDIVTQLQAGDAIDLRELAAKHTLPAFDTLLAAASHKPNPHGERPSWSVATKEATQILDYGHGRAGAAEAPDKTGGLTIVINNLTEQSQLEKVVQSVREANELPPIEISPGQSPHTTTFTIDTARAEAELLQSLGLD